MQQKQPEQLKRTNSAPIPRVSRKEFGQIEEGDGSIWAVSYADLLMVLMSFFVVFFSFTDTSKEVKNPDGLLKLAMGFTDKIPDLATNLKNTKNESSASTGSGTGSTFNTGSGTGATLNAGAGTGTGTMASNGPSNKPSTIVDTQAFKQMGATVSETGKSLFIQLPDDIFGKRQYSIDESTRVKLTDLYKVLQAKQDQIEIVVIGHSDSSHVTNTNNPYLSNNFDLSSLRALRALQFLISLGFPQANISAQGAADGLRNSRSISIRIQMKETST